MVSISSRNSIRSVRALLFLLMLLSMGEAALSRRSIRGINDAGDYFRTIESQRNQRQLQAIEEAEGIRKAKEPSPKTDVPLTSPDLSNESTRAPGLVYNVDEESETEDANTKAEVCLGVSLQEPPSAIPDEYSIRNFAMMVDVLYGQFASVSPRNIESLLNEQNIALALSIAGCDDEPENTYDIETADGKRRRLQTEIGVPLITYSEVGAWKAKGPCVENTIAINPLKPWKDLCQRSFSSMVQLRAKQSSTSEDLIDQVARAFGATSKPAVQTNRVVYAVAIREIYQESETIPETDSNQGAVRRKRMPVRNILMYTLGAACIFVSIIIFIQLGLYEKRKKAILEFHLDSMSHILFEETRNDHSDSDSNSVDSAIDLMLVAVRGSSSSDQPSDELVENNQRYDEGNVMTSPTYAKLDIEIPSDGQNPERIRNIGRSQSYLTTMNTRITVVETTPDFERRVRSLDAAASKRNYSHEEC